MLTGAAIAEGPGRPVDAGDTVVWSSASTGGARSGHRAVLTIRGAIRDGWHIYGIKQSANGPTPLLVTVEPNDVARGDGRVAASAPTLAFDRAFGFVTPTHARDISLTVPVRVRAGQGPGHRQVPIGIRYQSCDGRVCLPPRTVHVAAPVEIAG